MADMIDVLKAMYAALNRGDIEAVAQAFDPQIAWIEPSDYPGGGTHRGVEVVKAHLVRGRSTWAEGGCEPERFVVAGDKVAAFLHIRVRLHGHNGWIDARHAAAFTFRNGKAIEMRIFDDEQEALAWAGQGEYVLHGAAGSGSVAVEAALTLLGIPFRLVEGETWTSEAARARVGTQNAMRQVPTLVLPGGETLTESAAILLHLADSHPAAGLSPALHDPQRAQFLRWMFFVSSAIYSLYWIKPDVSRIGAPQQARDAVIDAVHERIAFCWRTMDAQLTPGTYLLGDQLTVLDLYVAVISRFGPWRERFCSEAPRMAAVVRRVDQDPRLKALWDART